MTKEQEIENSLIAKLQDLKYTYREDIRDKATLEMNFREKFEALNHVRLTDSEFAWIKTANPEREVMLKRRGGQSVILNIDLENLGEYLNVFSSNIKDVRKFELSQKDNKEDFVNQYLYGA